MHLLDLNLRINKCETKQLRLAPILSRLDGSEWRASDSQSEGREFDSHHGRQFSGK